MTAIVNLDHAAFVHGGAAVAVLHRRLRQGAQRVQLGDEGRRQLHPRHLGGDVGTQGGEQVVFQRRVPVGGGEHLVLQVLQLLGDEPLAVDQRLLADIVLRHLVAEGVGHLDIVPEHLVVAHPQGADAGLFLFTGLQLGDEALAAGQDAPQTVHLRVEAGSDHAALPNGERRLVHQRPGDALRQVVQRLQLVVQLGQRPGGERGQLGLHRRKSFQ